MEQSGSTVGYLRRELKETRARLNFEDQLNPRFHYDSKNFHVFWCPSLLVLLRLRPPIAMHVTSVSQGMPAVLDIGAFFSFTFAASGR